jgi:uncharacterized protein YaeQ
VYRFDVDLSDVDRGVYAQLALRPALHPSELVRSMLARVLAYCLSHEEGIAFSRGLGSADEPAVWIKDLQGTTQAWIEVGSPSAERLHRASKATPRVVVFTHHTLDALAKSLRGKHVHRAEAIGLYALDAAFLEALEALTERSNAWTLARSDGDVYLTARGQTLTTRLDRRTLAELAG